MWGIFQYMYPWTPNPALYLSPEMVAELALGQDDPLTIAAKYGLSTAEFESLNSQEWFGQMVYQKREELTSDGMTFKIKARMIAEEVMQDVFSLSKTPTGMRPEHRLEFLKQVAEYGGLKPKQGHEGPTGPAFAITINLPDNPTGPQSRAITGETMVKPDPMIIDMNPIPPKPEGFKVPDFKLTNDLTGAAAVDTSGWVRTTTGAKP